MCDKKVYGWNAFQWTLVRVVHEYDIDPQIPSRSHDIRCMSPKTKSQICNTSPHPSPLMIFRRGDKANMNNTRNSSLPISVDVPVFCVMDFDDDSAVNTKCPLCCTNKVMFCICARVLHIWRRRPRCSSNEEITKDMEVTHGVSFPRGSDADLPIVLKTERRYYRIEWDEWPLMSAAPSQLGACTQDVCKMSGF